MSEGLDPIILEILWNRLIAIIEESSTTLERTSFSSVLRDAHDYACVIFDNRGELIAQPSTTIPGFAACVVNTVKDSWKRIPPEDLKDGDVLIWNDPYIISGQKIDITLIEPIFFKGGVVAYALNIAHHVDIGMAKMGTTEATHIFEEGLNIPLCKIQDAGRLNENVVDFIRANVRVPDKVVGDLRAQFAANRIVSIRIKELLEEFGWDDLQELAEEIIDRTEADMRALIRKIPDGVYRAEKRIDSIDGEPVKICLAIYVNGDEITIDCEGTSPQVKRGVNVALNFTRTYLLHTLKCLINPEVANNAGAVKPVTIKVPEGCILNFKYPAPGYARVAIVHYLPEIMFEALASAIPERVIAASGAAPLWVQTFMGKKRGADETVTQHFFHGGMGASSWKDGRSCLAFPHNLSNVPIELLESEIPVLFEKKEFICDSGGPGKFRGGLGQELVSFIPEGDIGPEGEMRCGMRGGRYEYPVPGIMGGKEARVAEIILNGKHTKTGTGFTMEPCDRLALRLSGGGGYGDPMERDPRGVEEDVLNGLVSVEAAKAEYGVVINEKTGKVDNKATEKLRGKLGRR